MLESLLLPVLDLLDASGQWTVEIVVVVWAGAVLWAGLPLAEGFFLQPVFSCALFVSGLVLAATPDLLAGLVFAVGATVYVGLALTVGKNQSDEADSSLTRTDGIDVDSIMWAVVGLLLFGAVGGYLMFTGVDNYRTAQATLDNTESVEAEVLQTQVETKQIYYDGQFHTTHYPVVFYEYEYGDTTYTSESVYPGDNQGGSEAKVRAILGEYPTGSTTTAYVDPDDPETSFLRWEYSPVPDIGGVLFGSLSLLLASIYPSWFVSPD